MKIENEYGTIEILKELKYKMGKIKCFCGNIKIGNLYKLRTGAHKSCGCLSSKIVDYTGQKIGNMTVIGKEKGKQWECICECGNTKFVEATILKNGGHKDCRCKWKEEGREYKTKIYRTWTNYRIKNILSEEFKIFKDFKLYVENKLKPPSDLDFLISRVNILEKCSKTNIKIQILSHIKTMCDIEYKFCVTCQRYIQNSPKFYTKDTNTCNICQLRNKLKRKFNLEYTEYLELLKNSNRQCEICKKDLKFGTSCKTGVIDHCHKSNKVRGILCKACNVAIGLLKDDPKLIKNTIEYLNRGDTKYKFTHQLKKIHIIDELCPITNEKENLSCDHNHETGFIRGNINNNVNLAIGLVKNSIENLKNSIIYLEKGV